MRPERCQPRKSKAHEITIATTVPAHSVDDLWKRYEEAFIPLRELALLNHLYERPQFEALLHDPDIYKLIARSGDQPIGLAMVTSQLESVPQISPPFLRARYPEHADRDAIFFGILVFVSAEYRQTSLFARLVSGMGQIAARRSGVIVFDVSSYNRMLGVDTQLARVSRWFKGSDFEEIDAQTYFAATLPEPLARVPLGDVVIDLTGAAEAPANRCASTPSTEADHAPATGADANARDVSHPATSEGGIGRAK